MRHSNVVARSLAQGFMRRSLHPGLQVRLNVESRGSPHGAFLLFVETRQSSCNVLSSS